jgi:hypothetical protein
MEGIPLSVLDQLGALVVALLIALGVITRKLRWHKDVTEQLSALTEDRDFWRDTALRLLGVTEQQAEASDVTAKVLSALPEPPANRQET